MRRVTLACALLLAGAAPAVAQVDGSGTITTGGASQQVFAGNPYRVYLFCENPIAATETLFINVPTAAGSANGSYELAPGGSVNFASGFIPLGPVYAYAATTGHRFICKN